MWFRDHPPGGAELIGECEAFLRGRLAERLDHVFLPVPVWVWTNLLAHGTEDDLRAERTTPPAPWTAWSQGFPEARSFLAGEILDHVERFGPLPEVQRAALAPLELELARRPEVERWRPREWVACVQRALDRHGQSCQRADRAARRPE